jgi:hypothetical protein
MAANLCQMVDGCRQQDIGGGKNIADDGNH